MNRHQCPISRWWLAALLVCWLGAAWAHTGVLLHRPMADSVLVVKSKRKLYLLKDGEVLRAFHISLGLSPNGAKQEEGDLKTPEGQYFLGARNPNSDYFLSIRISYPNAEDQARARAAGVDPGGQIMIHGLPNHPDGTRSSYLKEDWTNGCIAVSDSAMLDIWLMTTESTPIEIRP